MSELRHQLLEEGTLTVKQAVAFTGISRSGLYELTQQGFLVWTKVGGRRLIPKRALLDLLAERLQGGGQ